MFGGLRKLLGIEDHQQPHGNPAQVIQAVSHANVGIPGEFHQPQGGRQIPDPQQAMATRYAANPTSPEFLGVDPAQFGYPADDSGLHQTHVDINRASGFNDPRHPRASRSSLRDLLRSSGVDY
jgi:hypothetical protein